mmetsp:Transcript_13973/g.16880  ORF Transcript_13973/g.16880 Transcript_13973/m.16880 type:complete len:247 (-) Transcript_13973:199-939(-)|eukprot:CAMPEP_0197851466 /NCGR_PEP_ID=MMETSP1438-20131217/18171_1 /TAXON_ID=1461541 /ORGANISM="Pterosperma sp., Strain CCMP1384" /LENGTH=246 /DNA_ID=CAMNT_0043465079 /DNA_START=58 /DNA_END=798 /DNA_ORIENTATION=+
MSAAVQNVSGFSVVRFSATSGKPQQKAAALSSRMANKQAFSPKFGAPNSQRAMGMKVSAGDFDDPEYLARKAAAVAAQQAYKNATPNEPMAGGGPTHGGGHSAPAPPAPTFTPSPPPTFTPSPPPAQSTRGRRSEADLDAEAEARRAKAIAAQQAYRASVPNEPVPGGGPTHGGGHGAPAPTFTPSPPPTFTPTPAPAAAAPAAPAPGAEETPEERRARLVAAQALYKAVTPNEPIPGGGPTHGSH